MPTSQGREYVIGLMRAAGLDPRIDPAGNIFGRRPGGDASLPPILFGSHIDSVPNGGNFDGDLGSLVGARRDRSVRAAQASRTRHPLEMVVWAHEEGVAFGRGLAGSRIVAGDVKPADLDRGLERHAARATPSASIGGDPDRIDDAIAAEGRAALLPRTAHRAGRHARSRPASRSASSRASSRSTATMRS